MEENKERPDPARINNPYARPLSEAEKRDAGKSAEQEDFNRSCEEASEKAGRKPKIKVQKVQVRTRSKPLPKGIHIHTIICLVFMGLAVFSVLAAFGLASFIRKNALRIVENLSFTEQEAPSSFYYYDNNLVWLEEDAYTVVQAGEEKLFPEGKKLAAIYARVESTEYRSGNQLAFQDCYIGYEQDGQTEYQTAVSPREVLPYIASCGFVQEGCLSPYGSGNGISEEGWLFFFVPEEVEDFTLFMEIREERNRFSRLKEIYTRDYQVLPKDEDEIRSRNEGEVE